MNYWQIALETKSIILLINDFISDTKGITQRIEKKMDILFSSKLEAASDLLNSASNSSNLSIQKMLVVNSKVLFSESKSIYGKILKNELSNNQKFMKSFSSNYQLASSLIRQLVIVKSYLISLEGLMICNKLLKIKIDYSKDFIQLGHDFINLIHVDLLGSIIYRNYVLFKNKKPHFNLDVKETLIGAFKEHSPYFSRGHLLYYYFGDYERSDFPHLGKHFDSGYDQKCKNCYDHIDDIYRKLRVYKISKK